MDVHEDDDTEKDNIEVLYDFTKQDTKVAEIKSLGFVLQASKNIPTVFQEIVFFFLKLPKYTWWQICLFGRQSEYHDIPP